MPGRGGLFARRLAGQPVKAFGPPAAVLQSDLCLTGVDQGSVGVSMTAAMRSAFADYARSHEAASIRLLQFETGSGALKFPGLQSNPMSLLN